MAARAHGVQVEVEPDQARNEVLLVGRVSGTPEERELPSGDVLVAWRVVVDRPPSRRATGRSPTIDTVDCVAWAGAVRRTARGLGDGDVVSLQGSLRRRFWRAGPAAASRTEVEVESLRRVRRRQG